jgi:hypothetical protein
MVLIRVMERMSKSSHRCRTTATHKRRVIRINFQYVSPFFSCVLLALLLRTFCGHVSDMIIRNDDDKKRVNSNINSLKTIDENVNVNVNDNKILGDDNDKEEDHDNDKEDDIEEYLQRILKSASIESAPIAPLSMIALKKMVYEQRRQEKQQQQQQQQQQHQ